MKLNTNVTLLIPGQRNYCHHAINRDELPSGKASGQWGLIEGSPYYNASPTDSNNNFLNKHLGKKVRMNGGY